MGKLYRRFSSAKHKASLRPVFDVWYFKSNLPTYFNILCLFATVLINLTPSDIDNFLKKKINFNDLFSMSLPSGQKLFTNSFSTIVLLTDKGSEIIPDYSKESSHFRQFRLTQVSDLLICLMPSLKSRYGSP